MLFSIIVAYDLKHGIGSKNRLLWYLKADLKHFKEITTKVVDPEKRNAVVMGRKTWQSLPENAQPLPGRLNVVLTRQSDLNLPDGVEHFFSFNEALANLNQRTNEIENIFCIGGGQIFAQAINHPNLVRIYATEILKDFEADIHFPQIPAGFQKNQESEIFQENQIPYKFVLYQKVS